jgi:hypothetical protein
MRSLHLHVIILILFSYPILTVWLTLFGFETSVFNLALKAFIVSLALLGLVIFRPISGPGLSAMTPLLAFYAVLGIRLIYDVGILGLVDVFQSPIYVFGYFFGLTLLPAILLAIRLQPSDLWPLHRLFVVGLVLANVSVLFFSATRDVTAETAFSYRAEQAGLEAGTAVLGPIMIGTLGAMLGAYAMGRVAMDHRLGLAGQAVHGAFLLLGGLNILFSGSRGPALAFGIVFLIIVATLVSSPLRDRSFRARGAGWLYAALAVIALVFLLAFTQQEIFLFERFQSMYEGEVTAAGEERNYIYSQAWADFLSSPIIGRSYMVSSGNYAAHNFVLEALMATGVLGGMLFALGVFRALVGTGRLLLGAAGPKGFDLALCMVCLLVVGTTSGSVRETPELWAMAAIMTIFSAQAVASERSRRYPSHPIAMQTGPG